MYIPKHFKQQDIDKLHSFMQQYPFAILITTENNKPIATHLPFVINKQNNSIILTSHISKQNNQLNNIENKEALVIFQEPHHYISPTLYEHEKNVPTWNYVAVHCYGKLQLHTNNEQRIAVLEQMINSFEPKYREQWKTLDDTYKNNLLKGIESFDIVVEEIQGKEKLSQNKTAQERTNIKNHLLQQEDSNAQALGKMM
ncbi:MAG: FMN-binding negative transcriptional regulator [Chitinophagales bacterium]|nr:FMN-binding negative transcriptional regulator [Chitinophagales bacterium]